MGSSTPSIWLTVSIDTEEDDWKPARQVTVTNIVKGVPIMARFLRRLGVRPTWFTTQTVAMDASAAATVRAALAAGDAELGAHLHAWNTHPFDAMATTEIPNRETLLNHLPYPVQLAKLESLTASLAESFGTRPTSFRAGRWSLGGDTVRALQATGYEVDSSVMPGKSWEEIEGPSFIGACRDVHHLSAEKIGVPSTGPLVEVPVSVGFTRRGLKTLDRVQSAVFGLPGVARFSGLLYRSRALRKVQLSPETTSESDLRTATRTLIEDGARHLHLYWHSQSHVCGTEFVTRATDRQAFDRKIAAVIETAHRHANVRFGTVGEVARALAPR